jgi:hypothetical protein
MDVPEDVRMLCALIGNNVADSAGTDNQNGIHDP